MAVAWFRNPVLQEGAEIIDRDSVNERTFGVAESKRHPAYVYSINRNACLMHKVSDVTIHWYALIDGGSKMGRLKQPAMIAHTVCGMSKSLTPERTRTCHIPLPDSVLCGRCHGEPATFGKHGKGTKAGLKRSEANVKLGCVVNGYPSALQRDDRKQAVANDARITTGAEVAEIPKSEVAPSSSGA
jgi:hypothetical protein